MFQLPYSTLLAQTKTSRGILAQQKQQRFIQSMTLSTTRMIRAQNIHKRTFATYTPYTSTYNKTQQQQQQPMTTTRQYEPAPQMYPYGGINNNNNNLNSTNTKATGQTIQQPYQQQPTTTFQQNDSQQANANNPNSMIQPNKWFRIRNQQPAQEAYAPFQGSIGSGNNTHEQGGKYNPIHVLTKQNRK